MPPYGFWVNTRLPPLEIRHHVSRELLPLLAHSCSVGRGGAVQAAAPAPAAIVADLHKVVKVPHGAVLSVADLVA